jgi:hypothetical protein
MNRDQYLAGVSNAWRGLDSNVWASDPPRWPPEIDKRKLGAAWLNSAAPRYWDPLPVDPVRQVVVPAASNPAIGSGPTPKQIEKARVAQQAEFIRQLSERWRNNLFHL